MHGAAVRRGVVAVGQRACAARRCAELILAVVVASCSTASAPARPDRDADRVPDTADNCIDVSNPSQADTDADGVGDACEVSQTVIHDEYFHPTSWREEAVQAAGGASSVAVQGAGELGNGGFYRRMTHQHPPGSAITVAHRLLGLTFDPATQGEVVSLDVEFDAALVSPVAPATTVEHALVVFQNGVVYTHPLVAIAANQWIPFFADSLVGADFRDAAGRTPNMSRTGDTLHFGYLRRTTHQGSGDLTVVHTIANLFVFIRSRPGPE